MSMLPVLLTLCLWTQKVLSNVAIQQQNAAAIRSLQGPGGASLPSEAGQVARENAELMNKVNSRYVKSVGGGTVSGQGSGPAANARRFDQECQNKALDGYIAQTKKSE